MEKEGRIEREGSMKGEGRMHVSHLTTVKTQLKHFLVQFCFERLFSVLA